MQPKTDITCDYVHSFRDYDGSWASAPCTAAAVWHVRGFDIEGPIAPDDDGAVDVFACGDHFATMEVDLIATSSVRIPERYRQGYALGVSEGALALMSTQTAYIFHYEGVSTEDELPSGFEPRLPLSGEWVNEAVDWSDEDVDEYRWGFTRGWVVGLNAKADAVVERDQLDDGGDRLRDL